MPSGTRSAVGVVALLLCAHVAHGQEDPRACAITERADLAEGAALRSTCDPPVASKESGALFIDIAAFTPEEQRILYGALANTFAVTTWPKADPARPGDSVSALMARQFGRSLAIQMPVLSANRITSDRPVQPGDRLVLPPIPRFPAGTPAALPEPLRLQVLEHKGIGEWDRYTGEVAGTAEGPDILKRTDESDNGIAWLYRNVPSSTANLLLARLPPALRAKARTSVLALPDPLDQLALVELYAPDDPAGAPSIPAAPAIPGIRPLPSETLDVLRRNTDGIFEIWDVYGSGPDSACAHGDSVRNVANAVLTAAGAGFMTPQVYPRDLDFYRNPANAIRIIDAYASLQSETTEALLKQAVRHLARARPPAGGLRIPLLYLMALSDLALLPQSKTLIVSQSFAVQSDGFNALTSRFNATRQLSLLASATNSTGAQIEFETNRELYPLYLYSQRRHEGFIVVGGVDRQHLPYGMVSRDAYGITAPGYATDWHDVLGCMPDRGNSYATPYVAAMLYLARVYWRNSGLQISAPEARTRLLLSARIDASLVPHYAAGGVPELERLLLGTGVFGITPDGRAQPLRLQPQSLIDWGADVVRPDRKHFFGLQVSAGQFFFLDGAVMNARWTPITLTELKLILTDGRVLTQADVAQYFEAIIGL